jgi:putative glutamine amidotransferase
MSRHEAGGRPVVGVTVELLDAPWYEGRRRFQLFTDYLPCLRAADLQPILLPTDAPVDDAGAEARAMLDRVDALLMTGGDDADLRALGGPAPLAGCKPVPPEQQAFNLALVREAFARDMPLLGVCFGMQMMGLVHDAPLVQHMEQATGHVKGVEHAVRAVPATRLAALVGEDGFDVPSFHHQALAGPGDGLVASAWAEDGTLEAIERPDLRYALGVQWHPERAPESAPTRALFSGLRAAAHDYRRQQS